MLAHLSEECDYAAARAVSVPRSVVDVAPGTLILEITGTQDKVDGLVAVLQPFGILELVHTGTVSMQRGSTPALGAEHRAPIVAA